MYVLNMRLRAWNEILTRLATQTATQTILLVALIIRIGGRSIKEKFVLVLITFALLCIPAFGQTTAVDTNQTYNPLELTDKNMASALNDSSFLVLDFYSPGCDPCKFMNNTTLELSNELQGQIKFGRMNDDANGRIARKYNITIYPTLLFFDEGILVNRIEGYTSNNKSDLLADLKEFRPELNTSKVQLPGDWNNKGVALKNLGKYDEAIEAFDRAIRLDPNDAPTWSYKGNAFNSQGKYDEAIKAYDEAIRLDPNYTDAWYNKGSALGRQGKYDEAIKCLDEAIRLDPNRASAWYNKGTALKLLGETSESNAAYAKAKELGYNG
jgi:tetratricopeptide (TPR) repeat protein